MKKYSQKVPSSVILVPSSVISVPTMDICILKVPITALFASLFFDCNIPNTPKEIREAYSPSFGGRNA